MSFDKMDSGTGFDTGPAPGFDSNGATILSDQAVLHSLIDAAFAAVETMGEPGPQAVLSERERDDVQADTGEETGRQIAERHWSDYSVNELENCTAALALLDVNSWRFHLPAFMYAALDRLSRPVWESGLPGAVLFDLTLSADDPARSRKLLARFRSLDAKQRGAVRAFLEFVSANPHQEPVRAQDAEKALRSFWAAPELARPSEPCSFELRNRRETEMSVRFRTGSDAARHNAAACMSRQSVSG